MRKFTQNMHLSFLIIFVSFPKAVFQVVIELCIIACGVLANL